MKDKILEALSVLNNQFDRIDGKLDSIEGLLDRTNKILIPLNQVFDSLEYICYQFNIDDLKNSVSFCKNCNIQNEYIEFDPNYICFKCKENF